MPHARSLAGRTSWKCSARPQNKPYKARRRSSSSYCRWKASSASPAENLKGAAVPRIGWWVYCALRAFSENLLGSACSALFWLFCSILLEKLRWSGQPTIRRAWAAQGGWKGIRRYPKISEACVQHFVQHFAKLCKSFRKVTTVRHLLAARTQPITTCYAKNCTWMYLIYFRVQSTHVSTWSGFRLACKHHPCIVVGWLRLQSFT